MLAIGFCDGQVILWNVDVNEKILALPGHSDTVDQIAWASNGQNILTASRDKSICQWNVQNGQLIRKINTQAEIIAGLAYSKKYPQVINVALIVKNSSNNRVVFQSWDTKNGQQLKCYEDGYAWKQVWLGGSSNRSSLALSLPNRTVQVWDLANFHKIATFKRDHIPIYGVAISHDQKVIALSLDNGYIEIWDVEAAELIDILTEHDEPVYSIAFSADSRLFASKSRDSTVRLWLCNPWQEISIRNELTFRGEQVEIAFHPSLYNLATFDEKNTSICIWSLDLNAIIQADIAKDSVNLHQAIEERAVIMSVTISGDGNVVGNNNRVITKINKSLSAPETRELGEAFALLRAEIAQLDDVPEKLRNRAVRAVEDAEEETADKNPNPKTVEDSLKRAKEILETTDQVYDKSVSWGKRLVTIAQVLIKMTPTGWNWLFSLL
jgi:WD40 repeat protein